MEGSVRIGRRHARRLLAVCLSGGVAAAGCAVAALADTSAGGVTPTVVAGNPADCASDLGIAGATTLTYNSNQSGTATDGTLTVKVDTSDSTTFGFTAQLPAGQVVLAVLAKGGSQGGNLYDYRGQPGGGVLSDTGLHPPPTGDGNQYAGLSHILFCYGDGTPTTTTTTTGGGGTTTGTTSSPPTTTSSTTPSSTPTTPTGTGTVKAVTVTKPAARPKKHTKKHKRHAKAKVLSRRAKRGAGFTG